MDFRQQVKQTLRMCGHALVSTVHERLNGIEAMLDSILEQNTHIASTQTALLQSGIHLIETLDRLQKEISETEARLVETAQPSAPALESTLNKMVAVSHGMRQEMESNLALLRPVAWQTKEFLTNQSVRQVCIETSDYFFTNPELGLMEFLYSYLPTRTAVDVGAHVGDVSEHLLNTGYEVYAFEPYPGSYRRLTERLGGRGGFHSFNFALGSVTGELPLYTVRDSSPDKRFEDTTVFHSLAPHGMPAGLTFERSIAVPIRRLADLHREGLIPDAPSLVKIDTEGYDLEVIRGMEDHRYPVVITEFWDTQIPFAEQGLRYTVESLVCEMRDRGYLWSIVIYRVWGNNETAFYCNHGRAAPNSWGNVVFFRDREIFAQAQQWCSAVLPRTYFRHVAAEREKDKSAEPAVK